MTGSLPANWRVVKLSDVCLINPRGESGLTKDDKVSFVPMAAVSEVSGAILAPEVRALRDVQKGFTPFRDNDVLFAKITPCMENGKAAVARGLINGRGYGSTEFHVIRASPVILPEWIFAIVRTTEFRRAAASSFRGAVGQQRVPSQFLANFQIPLPPISEQKRIVDILHEVEEIRSLRARTEKRAAELVPAIFRGLFGDIARNSHGWPVVPISSFVESFQGGKSLAGNEGEFEYSRPRVLKISAVTSGYLAPTESKALPSTYEPPVEHFVRPGDLLITRANTEELVGATVLVGESCPGNLVLPDKIWRFVWNSDFHGTPEFVWALFQDQATRKALSKIASGTGGSMKNINMKNLMGMRVVWPPEDLQRTFSEALKEALHLRASVSGEKLTPSLQSSMSAHALSGRLTTDWRDANTDTLSAEACARDAAMNQVEAHRFVPDVGMGQDMKRHVAPTLDGIYSDLNREQRALLLDINRMVGGVRYPRYFSSQSLARYISDGALRRSPLVIEGHLVVLAARGILIPVSRAEQTEDTGEFVFGNTYRLPLSEHDPGEAQGEEPQSDDHAHLNELERLASELEKERSLS